ISGRMYPWSYFQPGGMAPTEMMMASGHSIVMTFGAPHDVQSRRTFTPACVGRAVVLCKFSIADPPRPPNPRLSVSMSSKCSRFILSTSCLLSTKGSCHRPHPLTQRFLASQHLRCHHQSLVFCLCDRGFGARLLSAHLLQLPETFRSATLILLLRARKKV